MRRLLIELYFSILLMILNRFKSLRQQNIHYLISKRPSQNRLFANFGQLSHDQMNSLIDRIDEVNSISPLRNLFEFKICGVSYGYLHDDFAELLRPFSDVFVVSLKDRIVTLVQNLENADCKKRTKMVGEVALKLNEEGIITGWRNELLPVVSSFSTEPVMLIERAAYPWFGFKGYGVHVNGFVRGIDGKIEKLWVARRSKTKQTWPSMLDHIVAGGQPYGVSVMGNVVKECNEEANLSSELAQSAQPVGAVSYEAIDEQGRLKRDVLFCFDLDLPASFIPTPLDGEVESFELHDINWVLDKVIKGGPDGYKPNCNLVIIDFLIRRGFISPESPRYLEVISGLRRGDCK